jgi:hypothetical protein
MRQTKPAMRRGVIWAVMFTAILALADSGANAQCYPGLTCPDSAIPEPAAPSAVRPTSATEDCTLDGSVRFCVSSALAPQGRNSYRAANLIDGNPATAWVEARSDDGIGEWIVIDFTQPRDVTGIELQNGYAKNADIYGKNGRVRDVEINLSSGQSLRHTLNDSANPQTIPLSGADGVGWLQLKILSVYPGSKYRDTAISELRVK